MLSGEAYLDCSELPLLAWVNINASKDLKHLVKSGIVPIEELADIWKEILDEYRTLMGDIDSNHIFDLHKEIVVEDRYLVTISAVVNQLRIRRNEELIGILKNDFDFRLNYVDLNADLDTTLKQAKNRLIHLRIKEKEYNDLNVSGANKEFTIGDFMEQLSVLSEFQGYQIRTKDTTVIEYISIYKRFKADVEMRLKNAQR